MSVVPRQSLEAVFVSRHADLRHVALNIVRQADLADEIMQDAYIKVAECAPEGCILQPYCYCCRIVRNLAMDHFRRQSTELGHRIFNVDVTQLDVPSHATPEKALNHRQMLEVVSHILDTLPARTRRAFEYCRFENMSQREIGRCLGCSATLVNFMLRDATNALRGCRQLLDD
ncbi:sigma-70 family RNA polymerase sigma factor [Oxalicibacterium solurbis]|uniref:RNA polymerase factor sigma-70 n=1 Tax=Oxalicibacterium solurbis TaxID=69280 RepID=A0A8J3B4P6_9BURK|nr:sigma-70 family RNA polymerase sigma factor [Oxalicibacterium solurbis]GGI55043.1 RNA polymerase factor sigma-70 [Oxalicibacterium solurbis]